MKRQNDAKLKISIRDKSGEGGKAAETFFGGRLAIHGMSPISDHP